MRREQCCHVTYLSLAEPIDNRQVKALLLCRLSPRNNVLRWFYLFPSRYLDKKKESKTRARHLTCRLRLKCDGARAETRFRLSAKRTSPFKSAGASVQSTTGSRGVRISGSNAGYTMLRGSVKGTGYPLHSSVSPSIPLPCVTVCQHISTGVYIRHPCAGQWRLQCSCSVVYSADYIKSSFTQLPQAGSKQNLTMRSINSIATSVASSTRHKRTSPLNFRALILSGI